MSTYYSASDTSFNLALTQIQQNNQCYDSIANTLFSNPQYYTVDSCNNLLLTPQGNQIFQQLIQKNPECVNLNQQNTTNIDDMINQYQKMVQRRQQVDENMNMILNMNSRTNYEPTLYQQTNQDVSVSIMFIVLAISMVYYTVRHLND
jgi:membrane-bound lytic murein transglycosylase